MSEHRVVVIGSGFGGLFATKELRKSDVSVTMISRTTHHLFQPLLYQVATGILSPGEIAPTTREILSRQNNAEILLGLVEDIDVDAKEVIWRYHQRQMRTPTIRSSSLPVQTSPTSETTSLLDSPRD